MAQNLDEMIASGFDTIEKHQEKILAMTKEAEYKNLKEKQQKALMKVEKYKSRTKNFIGRLIYSDDLKKAIKEYNKANEELQKYVASYINDTEYNPKDEINIPEIEDIETPEHEIPDKPGTPEPGTPEPGTPEPETPEPETPEPGTPEPGTGTNGNVNNVVDDNNSNIESPINSISYGSYLNFIQDMQEKQWEREDERTKAQWEREDTAFSRGAEDARRAGYNLNLMGSPAVAPTSSGITSSTGLDYSLINSMASQESSKYASDISAWIAEYNGAMQKYLAEYNGNVDKAIEKFKAEYNTEIQEYVMYYEEMFFEGNMDQKEKDRIANIITSALATFSLAQFKKK